LKALSPNLLRRLEGACAFLLACLLYHDLAGSWLTFVLLFFVPDLSMLGYLANPRVGARIYNAGHTYLSPLALAVVAYFSLGAPLFNPSLIWVAHIGFDRLLGYGLKYETGFKDTDLGKL
jgi:hypothetical protein